MLSFRVCKVAVIFKGNPSRVTLGHLSNFATKQPTQKKKEKHLGWRFLSSVLEGLIWEISLAIEFVF